MKCSSDVHGVKNKLVTTSCGHPSLSSESVFCALFTPHGLYNFMCYCFQRLQLIIFLSSVMMIFFLSLWEIAKFTQS